MQGAVGNGACEKRGGQGAGRHCLDQFEDGLDFDCNAEGQGDRRDGRAGMASRIAQNRNHQIRGAIDDFGLVGEIGRRIDKADQFHQSRNFGQIPCRGFGLCQKRQGACCRCKRAVFGREVGPEFAANQPVRPV